MASPAAQLVLDILEKVGAEETLALMRASLGLEGPTPVPSLPPGVEQSDPDSALLVDIVSSLLRRTYTPSHSGVFSSSRVAQVEETTPEVPPPCSQQLGGVVSVEESAHQQQQQQPREEQIAEEALVLTASDIQTVSQIEGTQPQAEPIAVEAPAPIALETQIMPQIEVALPALPSLLPPSSVAVVPAPPPAKPNAAEGYLDYEEDSSEEESSPVLKPTLTTSVEVCLPSQGPPKKKGGWGDEDGSEDAQFPTVLAGSAPPPTKAPPPTTTRQVLQGPPKGSVLEEEDLTDMDFGALSASSTSVLQRPSLAPPTTSTLGTLGSGASTPLLLTSHATVAPLVACAVRSLQASPLPSQPMPSTLSGALRWLLVGERRVSGGGKPLYSGWIPQGLAFSPQVGLKYGIIQGLGGPCGPLAAINAECVKRLFFGAAPTSTKASSVSAKHWESFLEAAALPWQAKEEENERGEGGDDGIALDPTPHALALALVGALTDILWRAVGDSGGVVSLALPESVGDGDTEGLVGGLVGPTVGALTSPGGCPTTPFTLPTATTPVSLPQEGLFDRLTLVTCATRTATSTALLAHLPLLTHPKGPGLLLTVASLIATRGWERVDKDRDAQGEGGSGTLIDSNGYCTSELLHLFLCGRGVSNAVNEGGGAGGRVEVDGITLGGIPSPCDVGFLAASLHLPVGSHLLRPRAPVWVTFAASHYRLLFAAPRHTVWPTLPPAPPKRLFGKKAGHPTLPPDAQRCLGCCSSFLALGGEGGEGGLFDALLWDGLAKQGGMERVTVQVPEGGGEAPTLKRGERLDTLFAPTVLQLMTRFGPGTRVLWNDVEEEEALFIE